MSNSNNNQKDTIYIDVEDEITAVIDKVQSSPHRIIALVLPKRASVFQSVVNMKLLKRTAENAKKHVVLITSEAALLPLAGAVGLFVAPNLQTKPEIPSLPSTKEKELDTAKPVGELADKPAEEESLDVDSANEHDLKEASAATAAATKAKNTKADPKKKKPKIPNFESFRKRLIIGGIAALLLLAGAILAFFVLPKATVAINTNASELETTINFTASTQAQELDTEGSVVPSKSQEFRETDSERIASTGEKNLGEKAEGSVLLELTSCSLGSVTIPEGTTVSSGNLEFATQSSVTLQSVEIGGNCRNEDFPNISSETVDVVAREAGAQYNLDEGKSFSVAGYSNVDGTNEEEMTGGTNKIVKIVTQRDIDTAVERIQSRASSNAPDELSQDLTSEGFYPIEATLVSGDPVITTSPNVGDEAGEVTVTATTSYTMVGIKENDLRALIESTAQEEIDTENQMIREYELSDTTISLREAGSSPEQVPLTLSATLIAGPKLDEDAIKQEVAGKGKDDIQNILRRRPGVSDVDVTYSPFWVRSAPTSPDKITLNIEDTTQDEQ